MFKPKTSARLWRRPIAYGAALAATAGMSVGFTMAANATGGGSTTDVSFVTVSPAYKLLTARSMATNSSLNEVVIGGKTTVPSNATTVELSVEAGGTTAGVMNFNPTGNTGGGSGQFLTWSGGGTDTQTIQENVGSSDELTFSLVGATAKVTATIIGYSTQVTDGDVSGLDGTSGQVLTNTGSGAAWQAPNGGLGVNGPSTSTFYVNDSAYTDVAAVTVPAGSYAFSFTGDAYNYGSGSDYVDCYMFSPSGSAIAYTGTNLPSGADNDLAAQSMDTTSGGTFSEECFDDNTVGKTVVGWDSYPTLSAIQLSSVSGTDYDGPKQGAQILPRGLAAHHLPKP
jgi:hypothetical protein